MPILFFIALGCSVDSPCINQMNCSKESFSASLLLLGHRKLSLSKRLYSRRKPDTYPPLL